MKIDVPQQIEIDEHGGRSIPVFVKRSPLSDAPPWEEREFNVRTLGATPCVAVTKGMNSIRLEGRRPGMAIVLVQAPRPDGLFDYAAIVVLVRRTSILAT